MKFPKFNGASKLLTIRSFRRYWLASTASALGDNASLVAVPLTAVSVLHATPAELGLVTAIQFLPGLVLSMPAGLWADRVGGSISIMIVCDLISCAAIASIAVLYWVGTLTFWCFCVAVLIAGSCVVVFNVCDIRLFASLLHRSQFIDGQSLLSGGQTAMDLLGPSLGGLLVSLISAPLTILADALSFASSAILLGNIDLRHVRPDQRCRCREPTLARSLITGWQFIRTCRPVRTMLLVAGTANLFNAIFFAMYVAYLERDLRASTAVVGTIVSATAVGGIVAASLTATVSRRLGSRWTLLIGSTMIATPLLLFAVAANAAGIWFALLCVASAGSGGGRTVQNIVIGSTFAAVVPEALRSRVRGAFQTVTGASRVAGAALGGALGTILGLRASMWVAAAGGSLVFLWVLPTAALGSDSTNPAADPTDGIK
jgi:MFS family permease